MVGPGRSVTLIGSSVRAAAADAKRAGYHVTAIDRYGDRDLLSLCDRWVEYDPNDQWMSQLPPGPVVPLGGFQWPADDGCFGSRLVAFPSLHQLAKLDCPAWLAAVAAECGIGFPETRYRVQGQSQPIIQSAVGAPLRTNQWLRKPRIHGGGVGITIAEEASAPPPEQSLQSRLRGVPLGANFIAYARDGRHDTQLLGVFRGLTYRGNPAHPFLYGGSFGPVPLCEPVVSAIELLGQTIAEQLPLRGLFNVDLILAADGRLALIEVNPRYSASMELIPITCLTPPALIVWHLKCYQTCDSLADEIACFVNERRHTPTATVACKRIIYAKTTSHPSDLRSTIQRSHVGVTDRSQGTTWRYCDLPRDEATIAVGDPICTLIVSGADHHRECIRLSASRLNHARPSKRSPAAR